MTEGETDREEGTIPFYPDHLWNEAKLAIVILGIVIVVGVLALWFPVGQGEPADPMNTPAHAKPEWYFLFLYELLKYLPKTLGVILPILGLLVLIVWPFLDRREDTKRARRVRLILSIVGVAAIIVLTLLSELT
jgi:quinol-cytochrome oxidoreductase complex cytochrome b subunit